MCFPLRSQRPDYRFEVESPGSDPTGQKLLPVYGKPGFRLKGGDGVISALPSDEGTQENRRGHLDLGMELIISRFTRLGDLVCDPLLLERKASALSAVKQCAVS